MAVDFLAALTEWWESNAALSGAGIGAFHFNTNPGGDYPYVAIFKSGGNVSHRNFTKTYVDVDRWTVNVYSGDQDQASALGEVVTAALDTLVDAPLAFDDGVQLVFQRTGDNLMKLRKEGIDGVPYVWVQSLHYVTKCARTRV